MIKMSLRFVVSIVKSQLLAVARLRRAFTLIEILVVISVITMLSAFVLTYNATSRNQVALRIEQAELVQTISRAKSLALATYNKPEVPCGYGVYINYSENNYAIFSYDDFAY